MLRHIDGADMLGFGPADDQIARLDAAAGHVQVRLNEALQRYGPGQRMTLGTAALELGKMYGVRDSQQYPCDETLAVTELDALRARPEFLNPGLLVRYKTKAWEVAQGLEKQDKPPYILVEAGAANLPFPRVEYTKFPRFQPAVSAKVTEKTQQANNQPADAVVAVGRIYRSNPHALLKYLKTIDDVLLPLYQRQLGDLRDILMAVKPLPRKDRKIVYPSYGPEYLNRSIAAGDQIIHEVAETACVYADLGDTPEARQLAKTGLRRAIFVKLFRAGTFDQTVGNWLRFGLMSQNYIRQKQAVVIAARQACEAALAEYETGYPDAASLPAVDQS